MNGTTMSYQSAVVLVAQWIHIHGRTPTSADCTRANGLPHRMTLYYVCSGVSQAVSAALAFLQCHQPLQESPAPHPDITCLRCGKRLPWHGPHIRQCDTCRHIPDDPYASQVGTLRSVREASWDMGNAIVDIAREDTA